MPKQNAYALAMIAIAIPDAALATQDLRGRFEGTAPVRRVVVNNNFAQACLPALARAAARVNAVGSKFTISYTNPNWTTQTHASAPNSFPDTIVEPGAVSVVGRLAETGYVMKSTTPTATTGGVPYIAAADITVNRDVLLYNSGTAGGQFHCPTAAATAVPGNRYDMEYTFTHELTHVAGLLHNTTAGCLMYSTQNGGIATPAYCADESGMMINLYGRR